MTFTLPNRDRNERPWLDSEALSRSVYLDELSELDEQDLLSVQAEAEARARLAREAVKPGGGSQHVTGLHDLVGLEELEESIEIKGSGEEPIGEC